MGRLDDVDLSRSLAKSKAEARRKAGGERLAQLRLALGGKFPGHPQIGPGLLVLFEGWDAAGKGGAIQRLVAPLDPRHVRVVSYGAPSEDEKRHAFLRRFMPAVPGLGGMAVLDRTWYGRVLVERVEEYATEAQWRRAYSEIRGFEAMLHAEQVIIVKFWLHISAAEQERRFRERATDPLKRWKLTDEDWRNRGRRTDYLEAVQDMLVETDRPEAPWVLVPAEDKAFTRVHVLEQVIQRIEAACAEFGFDLPAPL
jgi:AMP-polyphosphate phosphotransferase